MVVEKKKDGLFKKLRGRLSNRKLSSHSLDSATVVKVSNASIKNIETPTKNRQVETQRESPQSVAVSLSQCDIQTCTSSLDFVAKGKNCLEADDFENALEAYDSAISLAVKEHGQGHLDVAAVYADRAGIYMDMFDWQLAIEDFKIAAKIRIEKLKMNDRLVTEVLKKLSYAMEQHHILNTDTDVSSNYVRSLTSDLRGSIRNLMGGIEEFCEDLEDDIHADHEKVDRSENCDRQSLTSESMKDLFRDFEETLDASLLS
mmetsp:Transcript_41157/g.48066  ORF Transcript_41157/g.48066 Transcript_41157/m.48066 type:complete len:259 (+) Transcript_41157:49-825(+)